MESPEYLRFFSVRKSDLNELNPSYELLIKFNKVNWEKQIDSYSAFIHMLSLNVTSIVVIFEVLQEENFEAYKNDLFDSILKNFSHIKILKIEFDSQTIKGSNCSREILFIFLQLKKLTDLIIEIKGNTNILSFYNDLRVQLQEFIYENKSLRSLTMDFYFSTVDQITYNYEQIKILNIHIPDIANKEIWAHFLSKFPNLLSLNLSISDQYLFDDFQKLKSLLEYIEVLKEKLVYLKIIFDFDLFINFVTQTHFFVLRSFFIDLFYNCSKYKYLISIDIKIKEFEKIPDFLEIKPIYNNLINDILKKYQIFLMIKSITKSRLFKRKQIVADISTFFI